MVCTCRGVNRVSITVPKTGPVISGPNTTTTGREPVDPGIRMPRTEQPPADGVAIVYTHPTCGYCDLLKEDLVKDGVSFREVDVSKQPDQWTEVERLSGGDKITPVMVTATGEVEIGYKGIGCNYN